MIKAIKLSNFKGHNREFSFGNATMIVGDNYRGKTGLFQAVNLGVHGWLKHPGGDKKLDPFGLSSGNPMAIDMDFNGTSIVRKWEKDRRGSVRYIGYDGEPLASSILLDARTYFDLSADKRMRFVFGAVKLADGEFSSAKLIADLKNLKMDPMTEAHQLALNDVIQEVSGAWMGFEAEKNMGADITIQDWLAAVIEKLKERAKLAKQAVDRMAKTVSGITELQVRDTTEIDANTANLEGQMQGIREQVAAKQQELGRIEQRLSVAEEKHKALAGLVEELNKLTKPDDAVIATLGEIEKQRDSLTAEGNALSKELGRLEADLTAKNDAKDAQLQLSQTLEAIDTDLESHPDQGVEMKHQQEVLDARQQEARELVEAITKAKEQQSAVGNEWSVLKTLRSRVDSDLSEAQKKLTGLPQLTECPYCACAGDNFREVAEAHFQSQIRALELQLTDADQAIMAKDSEWNTLKAQIESLENESRDMVELIKAIDKTIRDCDGIQKIRVNLLTRREELSKTVAPSADIAAAEAAVHSHRAKIDRWRGATESVAAQLKTIADMKRAKDLIAQIADAPESVDALKGESERLRGEKQRLDAEYDRLDGDVKKGVAAKADAIRQNQAVAERDKAKAEQDMTKLAVESVTAFQQSMVDKAFGTIIADANRFTDGILDSPLIYKDGEIGRDRAGTFVSHEYLSGTEQALCFAGISVALAMQSPFKLVMIDEMTRLSRRNKVLVFDRMIALIDAGVIHQFIGVDTDIAPYTADYTPPEEAKFIQL